MTMRSISEFVHHLTQFWLVPFFDPVEFLAITCDILSCVSVASLLC